MHKLKKPDPVTDPSSIGNVLMRLGKISGQQLSDAISRQVEFGEHLLGAWLRDLGFVNDMDVAVAMKIQAELRSGRRLQAELDVLQCKVDEIECQNRELERVVAQAGRRDVDSNVTYLQPRRAALKN